MLILATALSRSAWRDLGKANRAVFAPLSRAAERAFFIYGFAKSDRGNIDYGEEAEFKRAAGYVLGLSERHLAELIAKGQFTEVHDRGEEIPE